MPVPRGTYENRTFDDVDAGREGRENDVGRDVKLNWFLPPTQCALFCAFNTHETHETAPRWAVTRARCLNNTIREHPKKVKEEKLKKINKI